MQRRACGVWIEESKRPEAALVKAVAAIAAMMSLLRFDGRG